MLLGPTIPTRGPNFELSRLLDLPATYGYCLGVTQGGKSGVRDACVGFPLFHREVDHMRNLFVLIMITICGRSKVESKELSTSVVRILILLFSLSHILRMI